MGNTGKGDWEIQMSTCGVGTRVAENRNHAEKTNHAVGKQKEECQERLLQLV